MLHSRTRPRNINHPWLRPTAFAAAAVLLLSALIVPSSPVRAAGTPVVFRVDSVGNITANGTPIRIKGASWFGLEGRYEISTDSVNPRGAPMEQYMGNVFWAPSGRTYDQDISEFKAMGINTIRLPLVHQTLANAPCDPQGLDPVLKNDTSVRIQCARTALETIIKKLDAAGIYVLLDIHSCNNYVDWRKGRLDARPPYVDATRNNYDFTREDWSCASTNNPASVTHVEAYNESTWLGDLKTLAGLESSLGVSNIIGIDLFNEPWDYTWSTWSGLVNDAYNAINPVNSNILMFVQGTSDTANNQDGIAGNEVKQNIGNTTVIPNWGENLADAGANPPSAVPKSRLVFSPHAYGPSVFVGAQFADPAQPSCAGLSGDAFGDAKCNIVINPTLLENGWQASFGYLKAQGYAVVVGEWGGNIDWPGGAASIRDQDRYSYITDHTVDLKWQQAFVNYLLKVGIDDSIYWSVNPESGDTGGLYTTPYDPRSNTGAWGTWGALNQTKMTLVHKLWDVAPCTGSSCPTPPPSTPPSATPTVRPSTTPTVGPTPSPTVRPSSTPTVGPTASPTARPSATPTARPSVTPSPTPTPSGGTARCSAAYHVDSQWGNGFTATVTVTNSGTVATKTWTVTWTWGGNQAFVNTWNATITTSGTAVTAKNMTYNNVIGAGGNTTFGFQASFSGTNATPTLTCSAT